MPDQSGYVPVNTAVLLQTLVEAVHEQIVERREAGAPEDAPAALVGAGGSLAGDDEPELDRELRIAGYLGRVAEVDMFEPARRPADWVPERVAQARERAADVSAAVAELCLELANAEPVDKPDPDDPAAASWQVPGPGGHVRHYVARRSIEHHLRDRERPITGDPAELKRAWLYGFFVRTCEEALPEPDALALRGG